LRRKFADDWPRRTIVEAAHYLSMNLDLIEEYFPEARIIQLYRPAPEVVASFTGKIKQKIYGASGGHPRTEIRWEVWGDCFPLWEGCTSQIEGYARYWQACHEAIAATSLPRVVINTGELMESSGWRKLLEFVGIEGRVINPAHRWNTRSERKRQPPSAEMIEVCEKWCTWRPDQD
jgi:hypothetical protein